MDTIKSIEERNDLPIIQQFGNHVNHVINWDWIFSRWYEKVIVAVSILWSTYSLIMFAWRYFF